MQSEPITCVLVVYENGEHIFTPARDYLTNHEPHSFVLREKAPVPEPVRAEGRLIPLVDFRL